MTNKKRTSFTDDEKYLTLYDIKEYTSLSYQTLKKGYQGGNLKSIQVGNKRLFKKEWIDTWLDKFIEPVIRDIKAFIKEDEPITPELLEKFNELEPMPQGIKDILIPQKKGGKCECD